MEEEKKEVLAPMDLEVVVRTVLGGLVEKYAVPINAEEFELGVNIAVGLIRPTPKRPTRNDETEVGEFTVIRRSPDGDLKEECEFFSRSVAIEYCVLRNKTAKEGVYFDVLPSDEWEAILESFPVEEEPEPEPPKIQPQTRPLITARPPAPSQAPALPRGLSRAPDKKRS